jgi:hypothetical protein
MGQKPFSYFKFLGNKKHQQERTLATSALSATSHAVHLAQARLTHHYTAQTQQRDPAQRDQRLQYPNGQAEPARRHPVRNEHFLGNRHIQFCRFRRIEGRIGRIPENNKPERNPNPSDLISTRRAYEAIESLTDPVGRDLG